MPTRPIEVTTASSIRTTTTVHDTGATTPLNLSAPGDEGVHVKRLQESLARLGLTTEKPSSTFDAATKKAIEKFQKEQSLPMTGAYDAPTRKALRAVLEARMPKEGPSLSVGVRGEAVRTLEKKLKKQGLLEGPVDDTFDARTRNAVKALEKKLGAKMDGVADAKVWRSLGGAGTGSGAALKRGASGPPVTLLQERLVQLGHLEKGKTTGTFDAATERAVKLFEKANGLPVDGRIDAAAWKALRVHQLQKDLYGGPELKKGQKGAAVRILENALKKNGLLEGKVDGVFDAKTEAAVKKLEKKNGWTPDGHVGNQVWRALGGAGAGSGPVLKEGSDNAPAVKVLQKRLSAMGYYEGPADGDFGPMTAAAVKKLEKANGFEADGVVGASLWKVMGRHVVANPVVAPSLAKEPAHNYKRVRQDAGWINVRTQEMMNRAESYARKMGVAKPFFMVQGSYNAGGVSASGGTHDAGGAIDLRTWDHSRADTVKMVKALRMAGFAAWKRGFGDDNMDPHIHAIAIGDRELSSAARSQVAEYFRGGDGLIGSAADGDRSVGRPWPKWANKYR